MIDSQIIFKCFASKSEIIFKSNIVQDDAF